MTNRKTELEEALSTEFLYATDRQWDVLQEEIRRLRRGIEVAQAAANGRWSEWGERAVMVADALDVALNGASEGNWFEHASSYLDGLGRPYIFIALDVVTRSAQAEMEAVSNGQVVLRYTFADEYAVTVARAFAEHVASGFGGDDEARQSLPQ